METQGRKTSAVHRSKLKGVVRKVDELGRVVLPVDLRRALDVNEKDDVEIFLDGASIVLRKYCPTCVFCGSTTYVLQFKNKTLCKDCLNDLHGLEI